MSLGCPCEMRFCGWALRTPHPSLTHVVAFCFSFATSLGAHAPSILCEGGCGKVLPDDQKAKVSVFVSNTCLNALLLFLSISHFLVLFIVILEGGYPQLFRHAIIRDKVILQKYNM